MVQHSLRRSSAMKTFSRHDIVYGMILFLCSCALVGKTPPPPSETDIEQRVESLLSQMTLEEKIDYFGGYEGFYIRPLKRLGLPAIKMSDGPVGVRNYGPTTAYPAGIALAATWNPSLAASFGTAIGRDARARGVHIWLGPGLNIHRSPLCGRNFEYLGEDPFLASRIVTPIIRNAQEQGILATPKHYACNNQEYCRMTHSSQVDERTLREIYLPVFGAAVMEGKAGCVMAAYNLVNGKYCTENEFLNITILKNEWGFDGVLMSDWGATHNAIAAANNGLDLEMPSGAFMNRTNLLPAIKEGQVSIATIDDKVRSILRVIVRAGFLDRPQEIKSIPLDDPENAKVALDIAREGIVLLKNEKNILPLDLTTIKSLAVIGPNAHPGVPAGGGSSFTDPFHSVSVLDGIKKRAGQNVQVFHDPGISDTDISALADNSIFEHEASDGSIQQGLLAEYYSNMQLSGEPAAKGVTQHINFDWKEESPENLPKDSFSIRFTGRIRPEKTGQYFFAACSDDGIRVYLDGELIIQDWSDHSARTRSAKRQLESGKVYEIKLEYYENWGLALARFGWGFAPDLKDSPACQIAARADVAIVCVGYSAAEESEGMDRSFDLPSDQAELIRAVAENNPRTIVLLNSGGSVSWEGWLDQVPALVHAWYPGQEGGTAIAEILFGDINPSGKLPVSCEKRLIDNPAHPQYFSTDGKTCQYTEGIFVGYRGYDQGNIEPRFPFGHGLSYTSFEYRDLVISPEKIHSGDKIFVTFTVTNTGAREGAETAQLYVKDEESRLARPPKELKGFQKIFLKPGESKKATIEMDEKALSYFDPEAKKWVAEPGRFQILVGASSRGIRLQGSLDLIE